MGTLAGNWWLSGCSQPAAPGPRQPAQPAPTERPTTAKTRLIAHQQQVLRLDQESRAPLESALHTRVLERAQSLLHERLSQSRFEAVEQARSAFVEPELIELLETSTASYSAMTDRLTGQLHELDDLPDQAPDVAALAEAADAARVEHEDCNRQVIGSVADLDRLDTELVELIALHEDLARTDTHTRRLERVAAVVKGDNARNTSLENWVLGAHLRDVVELANVRLARSTQQRFQLCVLDDGENRRGTWGLAQSLKSNHAV